MQRLEKENGKICSIIHLVSFIEKELVAITFITSLIFYKFTCTYKYVSSF